MLSHAPILFKKMPLFTFHFLYNREVGTELTLWFICLLIHSFKLACLSLSYRIITFCCLIWAIVRQEKHKKVSVTSELHFSQGCGRAGNKEKGCIFERIKPPYYSITQNSCCYSFLQENSRRGQYRCVWNNEDILKSYFQSQEQASGVQRNVPIKIWGEGGVLGTTPIQLFSALLLIDTSALFPPECRRGALLGKSILLDAS